ncbi:hypothetical protein ScPMuIL_011087 [Solemya velum]
MRAAEKKVQKGRQKLKPYRNWKDAREDLKGHATKHYHKDSLGRLDAFISNMWDSKSRVDQRLSTGAAAAVERNRRFLISGIALREHRNDELIFETESVNMGNFKELLRLMSETDDQLRAHLTTCNRNESYISRTTQNQLLDCIREYIGGVTVEEIKGQPDDPYYGLSADEVTDCSNWEQLGIMVLYVKNDTSVERLLEFAKCENIKEAAIAFVISSTSKTVGIIFHVVSSENHTNWLFWYCYTSFHTDKAGVETMANPTDGSQWNKRPSLITPANNFGKIRLATRTLGQWNTYQRFRKNHKCQIPTTAIPKAYVIKKNDLYQEVSRVDLEEVLKTELASLPTRTQWAPFSSSSNSSDSYRTAPEQASVGLKSRSPGEVLPIHTLSSNSVPELEMGDVIFKRNAANERIVLGEGVFGYVCLATLSGTDEEKEVVVKEFTDESTDID